LFTAALAAAAMLTVRLSERQARREAQDTQASFEPVRARPSKKARPKAAPHPPAAPPGKPATEGESDAEIDLDELALPLAGLRASGILDTFHEARGGGERKHEALDLMTPRGTPVLAMTTGVVKKLFHSKPGGLTVYQFDRDEEYCYYYAHLDRYAEGLQEGNRVKRGTVIGYAGTTGNAPESAPHLHLAIFRLGPDKRWWEGTPVNPYPILIALASRGKP
jgi:murein DD-endopeptidase MepM/ murein hydrolase activator NlpD